MRASSHKLADAVAGRLGPVLPPPLGVGAAGTSINLHCDGLGLDSCSDAATIVEDEDGRSFGDRLETAVLAMMDGVQDCVMRELRIQWPFEADGAFAEPGARAGHDRLHLWFGRSEHDPAIRMDPIAFTEFCIGGSPARP